MSAISLKKLLKEVVNALKADYVVEQGTSGIWTYRKWNSGIAECWGYYEKSVTIAASSHVAMSPPSFPAIFIALPNVVANGGGNAAPNIFASYTRTYSTGSGYAADIYLRNLYTSAFSNTAWLYMYAIGKWK